MNLLLVDSSVWIQCFSRRPDPSHVSVILEFKKARMLATCGMITLEVARGARDEQEYRELVDEFSSLKTVPIGESEWDEARDMGFELARNGHHPPATDLLIAAVSIRCKCMLLHRDKHFTAIAEHYPLKIWRE